MHLKVSRDVIECLPQASSPQAKYVKMFDHSRPAGPHMVWTHMAQLRCVVRTDVPASQVRAHEVQHISPGEPKHIEEAVRPAYECQIMSHYPCIIVDNVLQPSQAVSTSSPIGSLASLC